jgi:hypothetical protein
VHFDTQKDMNKLIKNKCYQYLVIKYIIVNLQTLFERGMFNKK